MTNQDTSKFRDLVNTADHLKVPNTKMRMNLDQLHLTPEEKRIWGLDADSKFKQKKTGKENDFNPYA